MGSNARFFSHLGGVQSDMFVHICMNWSPGWVCQRTSFLWFSGVGALDLGLSELMDAADIATDVVI